MKLDAAQSVEQAGFRTGYSVDDHLFTVVMVLDRLAEAEEPALLPADRVRQSTAGPAATGPRRGLRPEPPSPAAGAQAEQLV